MLKLAGYLNTKGKLICDHEIGCLTEETEVNGNILSLALNSKISAELLADEISNTWQLGTTSLGLLNQQGLFSSSANPANQANHGTSLTNQQHL